MSSAFQRSESGFTLIELAGAIALVGVLGLATGQSARLNVVFLPAVQKSVPAQCTTDLKIFDAAGNTVAHSAATLVPNQSSSLVFQPDPTAVEIHAAITVPACPNDATICSASELATQTACRKMGRQFLGTMEIVDPSSGQTLVVLPAVQRG